MKPALSIVMPALDEAAGIQATLRHSRPSESAARKSSSSTVAAPTTRRSAPDRWPTLCCAARKVVHGR